MTLKTILNCIALSAMVFTVACSSKKETATNQHHPDDHALKHEEWGGMDEFHLVMAETFHPFKDSANLEPAKAKASELATAASTWAETPLPEKVNRPDVKAKLEQLKLQTASFVETVKTGDNKVIGESLTELHDLFHALQELWYDDNAHEHHEHH